MKVTLESTDVFKSIQGRYFRVWNGESEIGVKLHAYVLAVVPEDATPEQLAEFERDLVGIQRPRETRMRRRPIQ